MTFLVIDPIDFFLNKFDYDNSFPLVIYDLRDGSLEYISTNREGVEELWKKIENSEPCNLRDIVKKSSMKLENYFIERCEERKCYIIKYIIGDLDLPEVHIFVKKGDHLRILMEESDGRLKFKTSPIP